MIFHFEDEQGEVAVMWDRALRNMPRGSKLAGAVFCRMVAEHLEQGTLMPAEVTKFLALAFRSASTGRAGSLDKILGLSGRRGSRENVDLVFVRNLRIASEVQWLIQCGVEKEAAYNSVADAWQQKGWGEFDAYAVGRIYRKIIKEVQGGVK